MTLIRNTQNGGDDLADTWQIACFMAGTMGHPTPSREELEALIANHTSEIHRDRRRTK
jgi:hypothetical protein